MPANKIHWIKTLMKPSKITNVNDKWIITILQGKHSQDL